MKSPPARRQKEAKRYINLSLDTAIRIMDIRISPLQAMTLPEVTWSVGSHPHFQKKRGYAVTYPLGMNKHHILFSKKILWAGPHRIEGLLLHELGHILDDAVGYESILGSLSRYPPLPFRAEVSLGPERRADAIAMMIFGKLVGYDKDDVQTTSSRHWVTTLRPDRLGL